MLTALLTDLDPKGTFRTDVLDRYLPDAEKHGALRGSWLAAHRLCRCGPWGGAGFDPVPVRQLNCSLEHALSRQRLAPLRVLDLHSQLAP